MSTSHIWRGGAYVATVRHTSFFEISRFQAVSLRWIGQLLPQMLPKRASNMPMDHLKFNITPRIAHYMHSYFKPMIPSLLLQPMVFIVTVKVPDH